MGYPTNFGGGNLLRRCKLLVCAAGIPPSDGAALIMTANAAVEVTGGRSAGVWASGGSIQDTVP